MTQTNLGLDWTWLVGLCAAQELAYNAFSIRVATVWRLQGTHQSCSSAGPGAVSQHLAIHKYDSFWRGRRLCLSS